LAECFRTLRLNSDHTCNVVLSRAGGATLGHRHGEGEGEIWMDNLACTGTETNLADCEHSGFAQHNCRHAEDVSIECYGKNIADGWSQMVDRSQQSLFSKFLWTSQTR